MTLKEIKDKYLFKFCNPGNGPVLVCNIYIEKKGIHHRAGYVLNFVGCTDDKEGWDFVDNMFISQDGINFESNMPRNWKTNTPKEIEFFPVDKSYIYNFIERLFGNENSGFIDFILKEIE